MDLALKLSPRVYMERKGEILGRSPGTLYATNLVLIFCGQGGIFSCDFSVSSSSLDQNIPTFYSI